MILFAIVFDAMGFGRQIFMPWWMLLLFITLLVPISLATYRFYELPMQTVIRKRFLKKKSVLEDSRKA